MRAPRKVYVFPVELLLVAQQISQVEAAVGDGLPTCPAAVAALRGPGAMVVKVCAGAETINKPMELLMVAVAVVPLFTVVVVVVVELVLQGDIVLEGTRIMNRIGLVLLPGRAKISSLVQVGEMEPPLPEVPGVYPGAAGEEA